MAHFTWIMQMKIICTVGWVIAMSLHPPYKSNAKTPKHLWLLGKGSGSLTNQWDGFFGTEYISYAACESSDSCQMQTCHFWCIVMTFYSVIGMSTYKDKWQGNLA